MTTKPLKETRIEHLSHDGRGIARIDGKTTFIEGALSGERIYFHYTKRHANFDEGVVDEILEAHPSRQIPKCKHFGICGGCSLPYMDSEHQIEHKQKTVIEFLRREGIEPEEILTPLASHPWGYRRKARLSVKYLEKKNQMLVGFREKNGRFVSAIKRCEILHPNIGHLIESFSDLFLALTTRDQIPQMEIAVTQTETAIIIRHLSPMPESDLKKIREFCHTNKIKLYLQPKGLDSITLDWPSDADPLMTETLSDYGLQLKFMPHQFIQVNAGINQRMIMQAIEWLNVQASDRILDLFCGIGNFTLPIAKFCNNVVGVEGEFTTVEQAKANAVLNNIDNAYFYCDDLSAAEYNSPWALNTYDKILLDPPRVGAKTVIPWIQKWKAKEILYISCNPATFARDAKALINLGYKLVKVGVLDMFPHTTHIETMVLFSRDE